MTTTTIHNGRLCNILIRNLCTSFIAEKHNLKVTYAEHETIKKLGIDLFSGDNIYPITEKLTDDNFFKLLESDPIKSNLDPNENYFQTIEISKFLLDFLHKEHVKNKIIDLNPFKFRYNNNNDCFIHIRLGDMTRYNPGSEYYIKTLQNMKFNSIYIGTDTIDHQIIKNILKEYPNETTVLNYNETDTIQFGSTCKNIILSHGSFSAVIGYLSFFSYIYYPEYKFRMWFGDMFSMPNWNMIKF